MAIVLFTKDCYPYCKGDRIELSEQEQKDVDALAEKREVSNPYKVVEDPKVQTPDETVQAVESPEGDPVKPVISQADADKNLSAPDVEEVQEMEAKQETKASKKTR